MAEDVVLMDAHHHPCCGMEFLSEDKRDVADADITTTRGPESEGEVDGWDDWTRSNCCLCAVSQTDARTVVEEWTL